MTKNTPPPARDHGVTITEAAAWLRIERRTVRRHLENGNLRWLGKTAQVSCQSLADRIGYKASPEQIQAEAKAARKAQLTQSNTVK